MKGKAAIAKRLREALTLRPDERRSVFEALTHVLRPESVAERLRLPRDQVELLDRLWLMEETAHP